MYEWPMECIQYLINGIKRVDVDVEWYSITYVYLFYQEFKKTRSNHGVSEQHC